MPPKLASLGEDVFKNLHDLEALQDTTYGVEVEKYNLYFSDPSKRVKFIEKYQTTLETEQKFHTRLDLGIVGEDISSPPTAALCVIKKNGKPFMEVRLDGEREFTTSNVDDLKNEANRGLFNVEFISVGSGIKKHAEFMDECSKGADSDITKAVNGFKTAMRSQTDTLRESSGAVVPQSGLIISTIDPTIEYEFTQLGKHACQIAAKSPETYHPLSDGRYEGNSLSSKSIAFHVTHSIAIRQDISYIRSLGEAFGRNVDPAVTDINEALKIVFVDKDDEQGITHSRNRHNPLFKSIRTHFVPAVQRAHTPGSQYVTATEAQAVLQPTSNRLDYLKKDVEVYQKVSIDLELEIQRRKESAEALDRELKKANDTLQKYKVSNSDDIPRNKSTDTSLDRTKDASTDTGVDNNVEKLKQQILKQKLLLKEEEKELTKLVEGRRILVNTINYVMTDMIA